MEEKKVNLWSDGYGEQLHLLDENDEYPVAGYHNLLNEVYRRAHDYGAKKVLDLGFGTGILTRKLYQDGIKIYGIDASEHMVEAGKELMPEAELICHDYSLGMPLYFIKEEFDVIISTYAFHHMDHLEKLDLIEDLLNHLKEGGKIIIGDLSFESLKIQKEFKKQNREKWMREDRYVIYDEVIKDFPNAKWTKISKCAGIVEITKE